MVSFSTWKNNRDDLQLPYVMVLIKVSSVNVLLPGTKSAIILTSEWVNRSSYPVFKYWPLFLGIHLFLLIFIWYKPFEKGFV